ncbi:class I SAM-dependent methyltransferase [Ferrovibrio sp.]|uniref:class I SAM-dependent methyltransferase n=1 Tax=Ferrovibrio sp. TaxID=1917215 RepID=UPI0025C1B7C0|nr:class I SAM-dependent methyltransferase [Ferrovibrio sp.]
MERDEYYRMAELEAAMWWYRALHAHLAADLAGLRLPAGARLLDAGCGTGGLLRYLNDALPGLAPEGVEFDPEAAALARQKSGRPVVVGSVNALPYAPASFDAIVSADVLCHAGVQPGQAWAEWLRCLKPGGWLLLNLPAYGWMASAHDRHVHNARRYTASGAKAEALAAGFAPVRAGYWNSLLFPLMLLHRLTSGTKQSSDVQAYPPWLDASLFAVTALERRLHGMNIRLPFGGSVWLLAQKPS